MLAVAVLAAGKGTRMKSALPKVLQPLAGATLVERVLASARNLEPERRVLIVGHQAERVEQQLSHVNGLEFVLQQPQNGTGHAVQQLMRPLEGFSGELLVLNGDVPLLKAETIDQLVSTHRSSGADVTLLTARLDDPTGYGRVFVDGEGCVSAIIEHRDCSEEQRTNNLTNAGIYCFNWERLAAVLPQLSTDNDQESSISPTPWPCSNGPCMWKWPMLMKSTASTTGANWPNVRHSPAATASRPLDG